MINYVCKTCGSDDVRKDAWAKWDWYTQEWYVETMFDKSCYCNACEGECTIIKEEEDLNDEEIFA